MLLADVGSTLRDLQVYLLKLTTASSGNTEVWHRAPQMLCSLRIPVLVPGQVRLHRVLSGNSSSPTAVMFSEDSSCAQVPVLRAIISAK